MMMMGSRRVICYHRLKQVYSDAILDFGTYSNLIWDIFILLLESGYWTSLWAPKINRSPYPTYRHVVNA